MPEASSSRPPEEKRSPFFERALFKGAVAVVGLLAAVWAFTGAPKPWQVAAEINAGPTWLYNTEIIVDASAGMRKRFGGKTKLEVAVDGVAAAVRGNENENLALRSAGGGCDGEGSALVDFGPDHADDVVADAEGLQPRGRSNMVSAVLAAIDEFKAERFQRPDAKNRILVFMGAEDECAFDPRSEIRRELARADIEASFQFFALRMSKEGMRQLRSFRREMRPYAEVDVANAHSVKEFEEAIAPIAAGGNAAGATPESDDVKALSAPEEEATASSGDDGVESASEEGTTPTETTSEPSGEEGEAKEDEGEELDGEEGEEEGGETTETTPLLPPPEPGQTTGESGVDPTR